MVDLTTFARETERFVEAPPYERLLERRRRQAHRRAAAFVSVFAVVVAVVLGLHSLGTPDAQRPATPEPKPTSVSGPVWTADQVVGEPHAFVVAQFQSSSDGKQLLTVWKRCFVPVADHDCRGQEALAVVDGTEHSLSTLGAVTGSTSQPSGDRGTFEEIDPGRWYWAHTNPGPYLLSAIMHQPRQVAVLGYLVTPAVGLSTVDCADGIGRCLLDPNGLTLKRVDLPDVAGLRWATPTSCGFWGLAGIGGAGGHPRLIIQQADGSFATVALSEKPIMTFMAEGGRNCEIAVFQGLVENQNQLLVSLDRGRTWQVRKATPHNDWTIEEYPHLRVVLPHDWAAWPAMTSPFGLPGPLKPL